MNKKYPLSGRNLKYNYFKNQIRLYENIIELSDKTREWVESNMYQYREVPLTKDVLKIPYEPYEEFNNQKIKLIYEAIGTLTDIQKKIVTLYLDGLDINEIGKVMNRDYTDIWHWWYGQQRIYKGRTHYYGGIIQAIKTYIARQELIKKVKELTKLGLGYRKIAALLKISDQRVLQMRKQ